MKCCICKKVEFAVIIESHLPPQKLPNVICDNCLAIMADDSRHHNEENAKHVFDVLLNKTLQKGNRCG